MRKCSSYRQSFRNEVKLSNGPGNTRAQGPQKCPTRGPGPRAQEACAGPWSVGPRKRAPRPGNTEAQCQGVWKLAALERSAVGFLGWRLNSGLGSHFNHLCDRVCFGFLGLEAKTSLYLSINLVTSDFSSRDSLSLILISARAELGLSSGATLMTISSAGWIKPIELRDFNVMSDEVTLRTVI